MKKTLLLFTLLAAAMLRVSAQEEIVDGLEVFEAYVTLSDMVDETTNLVGTFLPQKTIILWVTTQEGKHFFSVSAPHEKYPNDRDMDKVFAFCLVDNCEVSAEKLGVLFDDTYPKMAFKGRILSPVFHPDVEPSFVLFEKITRSPHSKDNYEYGCLSIYFEPESVAQKWKLLQFYGRTEKLNHTIP